VTTILIEKNIMIPMRDRVQLATDVYRLEGASPAPVLIARTPLLLGATLRLRPVTSFSLYQDHWPVEQGPLAAKHMIGAHRQFVFVLQSCLRWPELALIAGGILTYLAAALPPVPTGFWDKQPKATPGRLRRLLAQADFPKDYPFLPQLRKKRVVTDHLPKDVAAHRRSKAVT
jgi:hypothetical protein